MKSNLRNIKNWTTLNWYLHYINYINMNLLFICFNKVCLIIYQYKYAITLNRSQQGFLINQYYKYEIALHSLIMYQYKFAMIICARTMVWILSEGWQQVDGWTLYRLPMVGNNIMVQILTHSQLYLVIDQESETSIRVGSRTMIWL